MHPSYYRGCWHEVSRCLFLKYRQKFFSEKEITTLGPSSSTRHCSVKLSLIAENSSLLPPVGVCSYLISSVAVHPLRPATDKSLGEPLPHQQANQLQARIQAIDIFNLIALWCISTRFQMLFTSWMSILANYSPVRHCLNFSETVQLACG